MSTISQAEPKAKPHLDLQDKKIAVIENEFGEVPIDNELLASKLSAAEQVVVMDNGSMCCTVRGDLLGANAQP